MVWNVSRFGNGDCASWRVLLLSYHGGLRMISEALELYVEGGRVSHSWCICVASHDTRSHRRSGAQLWVGSSRNW